MSDETNRFALMMEAFTEVSLEMETPHQANPIPAQPNLSQVLSDFGPMPNEALFLGVASDELPVLLNLHDSIPGPLLIIGDPGSGKTALLQIIASAAEKMHKTETLQFGTVTNHPDEWNGFDHIPNNIGTFPADHRASEDFILSLASWAHGNKSSKQSVLLLLDDLETVSGMDIETVQNLRWIFFRGPTRRVWPIITLNSNRIRNMETWLELFRTRIFGHVQNPNYINKLGIKYADPASLTRGSEFTMSEGSEWLRFSIPELD